MATLAEIEKLTGKYAEGRESLRSIMQDMQDEIETAKRRYLVRIKKTVAGITERHAALKAAIEESPEHFQKPKMIVIHGVKVGFQKQKGKIEWDDDSLVVKLIKKHYPDTWEIYVKVKETPKKKALADLSVGELKKIGVEATESGEAVVIKDTSSDIDKLVDALLKEDEANEAQEAA